MVILKRQMEEIKRLSKRDMQVAKFLEQPAFKRVLNVFATLDKGMDVIGSRFRGFGSSYSLRDNTVGGEGNV